MLAIAKNIEREITRKNFKVKREITQKKYKVKREITQKKNQKQAERERKYYKIPFCTQKIFKCKRLYNFEADLLLFRSKKTQELVSKPISIRDGNQEQFSVTGI